MQTIKFINHASVLISDNNSAILTDPWFEGSILNDGWNLLHKNREEHIIEVLKNTSHIWISHEHPDHFSVIFFNKYRDLINSKKIKILFQKTKDRRVFNFLKTKGFDVEEVKDGLNYKINDNFIIQIERFGFYDSALIITIDNKKIINLNDCIIEDKKVLHKFAKKYGPADLLLTQFSYAAWKGGKDNKTWRLKAASEKIDRINEHAESLACKNIIPFASFSYFSNKENFYMNEGGNSPIEIKDKLESKKENNFNVVVMQPLETQYLNKLFQNEKSLNFWKDIYNNIHSLPKTEYKKIDFNELQSNFKKYQKNIYSKNSKTFMYFLSLIPILNIFQSLNIYLYDMNTVVEYSIFRGIKKSEKKNYHVEMHSNSLNFIFKNEFGYDTLTANGNFETDRSGFAKLTKSLSIGSLNTLGYRFSLSLLFNPSIYLFFLYMLTKVSKNLENPYD